MGKKNQINYKRAAFLHPWNLTFLASGLALALGVSFVSGSGPAPFNTIMMLTMGIELVVLGTLSRNPRFRKVVKSRHAKKSARPLTSREIYAELCRDSQRRYMKLRNLQKKIEANYEKFSYASQGMLQNHLKKVDNLVSSCLKMMHQKERYQIFTSRMEEREVLHDMGQLQQELEGASESVRRIRLRRLKVLEHRLARFKKGREHLELLEEQVGTIEDVVEYIHEQSLTLRNPEEISLQLDVLMTDVAETESSLDQMESVFGEPDFAGLGLSDILDDEDDRSSTRRRDSRER